MTISQIHSITILLLSVCSVRDIYFIMRLKKRVADLEARAK